MDRGRVSLGAIHLIPSEQTDGFLGNNTRVEWLNSGGGEPPSKRSRAQSHKISVAKSAMALTLNAENGIPSGPGADFLG